MVCRTDESGKGTSFLRRLLGLPRGAALPAHEERHAYGALVDELLASGPLVLAVEEAQRCDDAAVRLIDGLVGAAAGRPLIVLLAATGRSAAPAAFRELTAREYCTVLDDDTPQPGAATPRADAAPAATGVFARHEPQVLRVALAASVLRSTDPDLVAALAGFPAGVTERRLRTARAQGLLPRRIPARGVPALLGALPASAAERMRAQAAEILNDAGRPAREVAELLLGQARIDRPWMTAVLKEAADEARHEEPAAAAACLRRLHEADPENAALRTDLATALLDTDPAAAHQHLAGALACAAEPRLRGRIEGGLRLAAFMTHRAPEGPRELGTVLDTLGPGDGDASLAPDTAATAPVTPDDPTRQLLVAARALRAALTGTGRRRAVADARAVLGSQRPRTVWARVAAARVLALADETADALDHLRRDASASERRGETWAAQHVSSARALLLLESGRAQDAVAAATPAGGEGGGGPGPLMRIVLALALVARADLDRAEKVLRDLRGCRLGDSVLEYHHHLMAMALVERGRGRAEKALDLTERCGTSLAAAGVENPVFTTWWVQSTELLMELGRTGAAAERAAFGRQLAERWPTPRSTGLSLLARGVSAAAAERVELLAESVRVLAASSDRHAHALAELRLGTALLRRGDERAARERLHTARATAAGCGLTAVAQRARDALVAAGGRPTRAALSDAERPVARMAASGASNRAIADALCLTVRTVEYHLTNVYRKLGVAGRVGLVNRLAPPGPRAGGPTRPADRAR
ncbi:LuxR C-terminal-related transcriptional regulator [Streptomyces sp. NPDC050560]|uniref:LuxR C-terminal-related transcriptional regulator n=1 Tax=Streptomyces sp. NPDC050560 TaxID=3365630 RepID=UPI0037BA7AC6